MTGPTTYSGWITALGWFRDGDDKVLDAMGEGKLELPPPVVERFLAYLAHAMETRLRMSQDELLRDIRLPSGDELALRRALASFRNRLAPIVRLAELPVIPGEASARLLAELREHMSVVRRQLEAVMTAGAGTNPALRRAVLAASWELPARGIADGGTALHCERVELESDLEGRRSKS
jgi:AcrR family transcriptional regulator